jgi:hypothetical protein
MFRMRAKTCREEAAMTTHIANLTLRFQMSPPRTVLVQRPQAVSRVPQTTAATPGWLDRLAAWSERQPMHHHLGSWMLRQ